MKPEQRRDSALCLSEEQRRDSALCLSEEQRRDSALRLSEEQKMTVEIFPDEYDVAIMGGGLAGLTLALQLKKARPTIKILVVEKQKHPVPEAAHKVGESTVEIAAKYFLDLGLQEHLQTEQLRKFGLRFFFKTEDNKDITRRMEIGLAKPTFLPSF